jgi:Transposase DDE domain
LKLIVTADGLYSKQPLIDALKEGGMSFILVAKPDDNKLLLEWVNDVPLNGTKDADQINFFQYQIVSKEHKITYRNSLVTDLALDEKNVITLVKGGRARWKIENEAFNTLKNQGYHIEHNFGHGQQDLSMNLLMLNLLAFYVHQILDLSDKPYQKLRYEKFTSRLEFWNLLRCTFRILLFKNWEHMLGFIYDLSMERAP